ncbi:MAG: HypC/HybG/HupF family hydrogenase formation chaperone [candidate division WOR-3 bacterium]|nr:HypC/HybG/HupF family hydrogenase formation chaperone [candidate division WOR-3 bacterium]
MCLAVIGRIERIDGDTALVEIMGVRKEISIVLTPEAKAGDYVMIHAGFAINLVDEKEAKETEKLLREIIKYS